MQIYRQRSLTKQYHQDETSHKYGTTKGTFPFQYLAEKKLDSMLFKRELYVEKKNDIRVVKTTYYVVLFSILFSLFSFLSDI